MEKRENRKFAYDVLRIVAALAVILIHVVSPVVNAGGYRGVPIWYASVILLAFSRVGVPLFLMISGALLLRRPDTKETGAFLRRRLPRVLLPFATFTVLCFVYSSCVSGTWNIGRFFAELFNQGTYYHLWYVYTIVALYLLAPYLRMIVEHASRFQLWFLLILIAFATTIRPAINTLLPVYLNLFSPITEGYLGFFLLGYLLSTSSLLKAEENSTKRGLLYALGVLAVVLNVIGTVSGGDYFLLVQSGYSATAYFSAAALFVFVSHVFQTKDSADSRWTRGICSLSSVTYGVYLIHAPILDLIGRLLSFSSPIWEGIVRFFLTGILSFGIMQILNRFPRIRRFFL